DSGASSPRSGSRRPALRRVRSTPAGAHLRGCRRRGSAGSGRGRLGGRAARSLPACRWRLLVREKMRGVASVRQSRLDSVRQPGAGDVHRQDCPAVPPDLKPQITLVFFTGTPDLNVRLVEKMRDVRSDLPIWVVSDFPPEDKNLHWIRYRPRHGFWENLRRCREAVRDCEVRFAAVILVPNVPFRRLRAIAMLLFPRGF